MKFVISQTKCLDKGLSIEGGLMWNDPVVGIDWESILPGITQNANFSEKDKKHAPFSFDKKYFDINAKWIGE